MKLSVRRDQPRGGGPPLVATPLMHELVEKKVKSDKNVNFLNTSFLNVLDNSESIETNFFFKKISPQPHPPSLDGQGGES